VCFLATALTCFAGSLNELSNTSCHVMTVTSVPTNSLRNLVTFTDQDYVVTDFHIVKELLMHFHAPIL